MKWISLRHNGPKFWNVYSKVIITLSYGKLQTVLNDEKSTLFIEFYAKFVCRRDSILVMNFWKSLLGDKFIHFAPFLSKIKVTKMPNSRPFIHPVAPRYDLAVMDGKEFTLSNYSMESPHIFIGRGTHPLRGTCKFSIQPNEVTINTSVNIAGFKAKGFKVVTLNDKFWTASWKDPITQSYKYTNLRLDDDYIQVKEKFDIARKLKKIIPCIHRKINKLILLDPKNAQIALAVFFIDLFCIRVGHEKDTTFETDTIGCCTLRINKHIFIVDSSKRRVRVDFNGKDNIPFKKTFVLPLPFFIVLRQRFKSQRDNELLFNLINPSIINYYLNRFLPGLTAKVFRTYNASLIFEKVLLKTKNLTLANFKAAKVCNHHKTRSNRLTPNLTTSRCNYIDPRIYFAFIKSNPKMDKNWFEKDKKWAGCVSSSFRF